MFITIEGGEGAGKSTLIANLKEYLEKEGREVIVTREPGGTRLGDHIRDCLLNPEFGVHFDAKSELLLFLASRAQHIYEVIQPAVKRGACVLCDRFNDSTIAYQGGGRGLGVDYTAALCDLVCGDVRPDITFFLDIDPQVGKTRIQRDYDRLESEKEDFHARVRDAFQSLAKKHPERICLIDACLSKEQVLESVLQNLKARML